MQAIFGGADPAAEGERADQIAFLIRIAKALHKYGIPAHRLEGVAGVLSEKFGIEGSVYSSPTAIFASFGPPTDLKTAMIRVDPGEIDLGRLSELDHLTCEVLRGDRTAQQGLERLEEILAAPPLYGPRLTMASFVAVATGASYLLGGRLPEMLAALVVSLWVGSLLIFSERRPGLARVSEALGAFGAAAIAVLLERVIGPYSIQLSIIAGLIPLLPGLSLTVAMTELATRNLVSGTTRLTSAVLTLLELVFGVALGSQLERLLPPVAEAATWPTLPDWTLVPALLLATAATTVLFRAKPRDILWVMAAGALAFFATRLGARGLGPELGAFVGSLVLCMASNTMARTLGKPAVLTIMPGLILLVPGSIGYRSLTALLGNDVTSGVEIAFSMGLIAISLVTGLLMANVVVPPRKVL
ncbi:threonine/serine ThrE exporter family protein [Vulgatibacter incomptus]|uniref:Threonine/serine exporter family protein n=1 Tax=Vulgatibacter incomptus TaxID=1391653 RepID=A0A0K1P9W8_9BACT|nr:threonine/serine exporter family protein [Vulgatibacter incomptus]AKU89914.1 hypothetical protein AKJ08_0301 [Vulgatibacter incomptus]